MCAPVRPTHASNNSAVTQLHECGGKDFTHPSIRRPLSRHGRTNAPIGHRSSLRSRSLVRRVIALIRPGVPAHRCSSLNALRAKKLASNAARQGFLPDIPARFLIGPAKVRSPHALLEEVDADGLLVALGEHPAAVALDHARLAHRPVPHDHHLKKRGKHYL